MNTTRFRSYLPILPLIAAVLFLGYGPSRSETLPLLLGYAVAFTAYLWTVRKIELTWKHLLMLAIGVRVLLFLAPITWTDDHVG